MFCVAVVVAVAAVVVSKILLKPENYFASVQKHSCLDKEVFMISVKLVAATRAFKSGVST